MDALASRKDQQIDLLLDAAGRVIQEYEAKNTVEFEVQSIDIIKLAEPDTNTAHRDIQQVAQVKPVIQR